jgi:parallel beta-helix repeat protein
MNRVACVCGVFGSFLLAGGVVAGPLTPPGGPVDSTGKTLREVEPRIAINSENTPGDADSVFRITQGGSYYLTGSFFAGAGDTGIEIDTTSRVTIDLNGFAVQGFGGVNGIRHTAAMSEHISIKNGRIAFFSNNGIDLGTTSSASIEDVTVTDSGGFGIHVGNYARVVNCTSSDNLNDGFRVGSGSVIRGCVASENNQDGFELAAGTTISDSAAYLNSMNGITGSSGNTIVNCSTSENGQIGIAVAQACTITGCTSTQNGLDGIRNFESGTVQNCTASRNQRHGIVVGGNCTVRNCTAATNGLSTDGSGILVEALDNLIEGNTCTDNDRGIRVQSGGNFITRNVCRGNPVANWDVVAGNRILVVSSAAAGAVVGNAGGVSPGSTDPNANYSY